MSILTRPILEINLPNLLHNFELLKELAGRATAAAVVKDDAYGLSAKEVAKFLYEEGGCRHFFVAHAVEAQNICADVPNATIYVLQGIGEDCVEIFAEHKFVPVISSPEMFEFWKNNKISGVKPIIHIETGLNRLGFRENYLKNLSEEDLKEFGMVMSHLSCADAVEHFMNHHQLENFERLKEQYFPNLPASLSASDGVFLGENFSKNMVRLGAAMYGINTAPYRQNQMKSVVKIKAPVLQIEDLPAGEFVGYSATYRANSPRKIAIISIGYGDGIPRSLSNVGKVFFTNNSMLNEARIIGRISMDNIICDVTNVEGLRVGDMACLLDEFYTLDDMGRDAGTIGYEIVSRVGKNPRFIRKYVY